MEPIFILAVAFSLLLIIQIFFFVKRYKRVGENQILIITGRVSEDPNEDFKILRSGAVFVWPVIQDYFYLDTSVTKISGEFQASDMDNLKFNCFVDVNCKLDSSDSGIHKFIAIKNNSVASQNEYILDQVKSNLKQEFQTKQKARIKTTDHSITSSIENGLAEFGMKLLSLNKLEIK